MAASPVDTRTGPPTATAGTADRRARVQARGAELTLLIGGAGAIAVGVGLGLPHLRRAGWSTATVIGILALVAGVGAVVAGTRRVLRDHGGRWRWAVLPVELAVLALSLLTLGQAVAASWVAPSPLGDRRPDDVGLQADTVSLRTRDGVDLAAWYAPGANGAAVVLLHGAGSNRTAVLDHAALIADHGYGVLLVDARGHGESGGRAMDFGWWGDEDLVAALDFLEGRPEVDPGQTAALGLSMGGEEAIGALAADERLAAVVAEGATNRVAGDKAWLSEAYGLRGRIQVGIEHVTTWLADRLSPAEAPGTLRAAVAAGAPRPVLLITAGDVPDEGAAARHIAAGAPGSVEVWTVEGADHTGGLATRPSAWEARVVGFLDDALLARP